MITVPALPRLIAPGAVTAVLLALVAATPAAAAPELCVGPAPGCSASVQAAVDAAHSGDTIRIAAGTYAGGISIAKSLTLVGAGASRTRITGGGPVITIRSTATSRPTVTFVGLTVTGGVNRGDGVGTAALGGGIYVAGVEDQPGGTAVLRHVVVEGNRTEPRATSSSPSGVACPGGVDCPFALSRGGGIAAFGDLVLDHSVVRGNVAGGNASDANGGGVFAAEGTLTVLHSTIAGNRAEPKAIGRFAEGGGLFVDSGKAVVKDSDVTGNAAVLRSTLPVFASAADGTQGDRIDQLANGGGIHVGDGVDVTIDGSRIAGNRVVADDPAGEVYGFDSGMLLGDSTLTLRRTAITGNSVDVTTKTAADVGPSGTALEIDGAATIADSTISGNSVLERAEQDAQASDALAVFNFSDHDARPVTVDRTTIAGNTAKAISRHGSAEVFGGGVLSDALLTLRHSVVRDNRIIALAPDATAQGGGIYHGPLLNDPPVSLLLQQSEVRGNSAAAPGGTAEGGGVYAATGDGVTLTLDRTTIADNRPDQCSGCKAAAAP